MRELQLPHGTEAPVADALTLELEPVVEANMTLDTEDIWFARLRPVRSGRELRIPRRTRLRDPSRSTLPRRRSPTHARSMLISRTTWPVVTVSSSRHFILEDWWGRSSVGGPQRRHRTAHLKYLVVTREVDPVASEGVRGAYVM